MRYQLLFFVLPILGLATPMIDNASKHHDASLSKEMHKNEHKSGYEGNKLVKARHEGKHHSGLKDSLEDHHIDAHAAVGHDNHEKHRPGHHHKDEHEQRSITKGDMAGDRPEVKIHLVDDHHHAGHSRGLYASQDEDRKLENDNEQGSEPYTGDLTDAKAHLDFQPEYLDRAGL